MPTTGVISVEFYKYDPGTGEQADRRTRSIASLSDCNGITFGPVTVNTDLGPDQPVYIHSVTLNNTVLAGGESRRHPYRHNRHREGFFHNDLLRGLGAVRNRPGRRCGTGGRRERSRAGRHHRSPGGGPPHRPGEIRDPASTPSSAEQIRNGGYLDIAQTLQAQTPGLYISPKNGPFDYADVSFLGSRTQDVLWLVDGVRINNRLYGGTTPLDTLPASMVERIVILEGQQALFYGTQGVAGAINILTKSFSDTPDGGFSIGGDTHEGKHVDGYFRNTLAGQHVVLFASDDQSPGFQPFRNQDYQPSSTDRNRSYNIRTVGAKYAIDPTDALRLTATVQHTEGHVDDSQPEVVASAFNDRDEDIFSAKLDYTPGEVAHSSPRVISTTGGRITPSMTTTWRLQARSTSATTTTSGGSRTTGPTLS